MLMKKGKVKVESDYQDFIKLVVDSNKYVFRGINPEVAELSAELFSDENKDPADRIISATSIIEGAKLVTADEFLRQSKAVETIWL